MNSPLVTYSSRPDVTAETEITSLANVYRFVLAKKEAAPECRLHDGPKSKEESANEEYTG